MNHVNAIRCNDEYQCSHCGKSWDIHEDAPDCKMTGVDLVKLKTVDYFGLSLTFSDNYTVITTDADGLVTVWESEPGKKSNQWWDDVIHYQVLGSVNLHGLDWQETLIKC